MWRQPRQEKNETMNLNHDVHIPFLLYVYNCLLFFFSHFFSLFAYILRVALCSQVLEWKSCSLAAWRGQWEHIIWIPTAAAQTLYWMYKEPSCGHQGIVTTKYTFRIYITHVFIKLLVAIDFYPIILYTCLDTVSAGGLHLNRNVYLALRLQ